MGALGQVGAQAFTVIAIVYSIINNYQTFSYYMDALRSLYYERRRQADDKFENEWRPLLAQLFESRIPFE